MARETPPSPPPLPGPKKVARGRAAHLDHAIEEEQDHRRVGVPLRHGHDVQIVVLDVKRVEFELAGIIHSPIDWIALHVHSLTVMTLKAQPLPMGMARRDRSRLYSFDLPAGVVAPRTFP